VVDESNLQRQIIHGVADVGRSKAQSARESIAAINPLIDVHLHEFRLAPDNAVGLFSQYDLILDGADNFATRYLVNDAAVLAGKPYVWGSIFRFEGQVSVFWEDAPDGPAGQKRGLNYRDLYPEPPPPGLVPSCAEGGVLGIICASPKITELIDYEYFCGEVSDDGAEAVTPQELRAMIDSGKKLALIDVREQAEWDIVHIDGAQLIPKSLLTSGEGLAQLPRDRKAVLYCKTGVRSAEALAAVKQAGFADAVHLQGGIVAWANQMQPDMVMY
jgi:rhodanese-related sulfurtransferase